MLNLLQKNFQIPFAPFIKGERGGGLTGGHAFEDELDFVVDVVVVVGGAAVEGAGNDGSQAGGLLHRESGSRFMKVSLRGGFDSEHAGSPFNNVQIQFENSLLG